MHAHQNVVPGWVARDNRHVVGTGLGVVVATKPKVSVSGWHVSLGLEANAVGRVVHVDDFVFVQVANDLLNGDHRQFFAQPNYL